YQAVRAILTVTPGRGICSHWSRQLTMNADAVGSQLLTGQGGDDSVGPENHFAGAVERSAQVGGGQDAPRPGRRLTPGISPRPPRSVCLTVDFHVSANPITDQRMGEFFAPTSSRTNTASVVAITRVPTPAPR